MKKLFFILALSAVAIATQAQVEVANNGNLKVGKHQVIDPFTSIDPSIPLPLSAEENSGLSEYNQKVPIDTAATMVILGNRYYRNGGKMTVVAEKVTLGAGFKVEAGGTLKINTK